MRRSFLIVLLGASVALATPALSQMRSGTWLHRNAADTTVVYCWNDSLSHIDFPPGCFGMGMAYPDSLFCEFEDMPLDSLEHDFDSTFICWRRFEIGSDSTGHDYLDCGPGYDGRSMMRFSGSFTCTVDLDSGFYDEHHRDWTVTGARCWDGHAWVEVANEKISGRTLTFTSDALYSAIALTGVPGTVSRSAALPFPPADVALGQNHPNPFAASTDIPYTIRKAGAVRLDVFDLTGRKVATLEDGTKAPGIHTAVFDAGSLPSGTYVYCVAEGGAVAARRLIVRR